ncbi:MAG: hypothetical protein DHS20C11_22780 [Lysobacteraceae bacterium]|nr:MAG: hypothetical protein DHS20C11_22780 [Xanthomonadaceae bacterium]
MNMFAALLFSVTLSADGPGLSEEAVLLPEPWQPGDCDGINDYIAPGELAIQNPCKVTRTAPPIELGPDLLGLGKLEPGFEVPGGAIWQPALYLLGGYRTALSVVDNGATDVGEWTHRLDLGVNLQLTATERVVLVLTPLSKDGRFTNYQWHPSSQRGWTEEFNSDIEQFWFEGDFGELFPALTRGNDPKRERNLEYGFSLGRQPLSFNEGMLIDDTVDSLGVVRNNLQWFADSASTRVTVLAAWDEIHRSDNIEDPGAKMLAVFGASDFHRTSYELDMAWVDGGRRAGDGFNLGFSATRRIGHWNASFRLNGSAALDDSSTAVDDGALAFVEFSTAPRGTHNVVYLNGFVAFDNYTSAARGPTRGGPLARVGLLFDGPGLGRFPSALSSLSSKAAGGAAGYQLFTNRERGNLVMELGVRYDDAASTTNVAVGLRHQLALGRRWLWQSDTYLVDGEDRDFGYGLRTELNLAF